MQLILSGNMRKMSGRGSRRLLEDKTGSFSTNTLRSKNTVILRAVDTIATRMPGVVEHMAEVRVTLMRRIQMLVDIGMSMLEEAVEGDSACDWFG